MSKDKDEEQGPHEGGESPPIDVDPVSAKPPQGQPSQEKPARQRGIDDTFTGRAAQLAVMAELLRLRCNVAIPEVDLGTDVFVFRDDREEVVRLQVKSCTSPYICKDDSGYSAKFSLPMKQFRRIDDRPPLYYALAVLRDDRWIDFLVVSRKVLQSHFYSATPFGSVNKANDELQITVAFRKEVTCSGQVLTDCRNAWGSLPPLQPIPDQELRGLDDVGPAEQTEASSNPATESDQTWA
jgi:hypothetical protein